MHFCDKIKKYIAENGIPENGRIVVGLSGGEDSVALLHLMKSIGYNCISAHCNFNLRGKESERDEKFAEDFTHSENIEFVKKSFDTVTYAKENKISIEMAARELRYKWFESLRKEKHAIAIAIAHHRNDNIETFLLNIIRGTGIRGLCAMNPYSSHIIRPFLDVSKEEIYNYIRENGLQFVTDCTNGDNRFKRNKIRNLILPMLKTINPSVENSINKTISNLRGEYRIYREAMNEIILQVFRQNRIDIVRLMQTPDPETVLFEILSSYGFHSSDIHEIASSINAQAGKIFYSRSHKIVRERNFFSLSEIKKEENDLYFEIKEKDRMISEPFKLEIEESRKEADFTIIKDKTIAYIDKDKLSYPLILRKWKKGDRFMPFGMKGFKKLSDFFNDCKFDSGKKENQWVLCNGEDIVWVIGERIDERYRINNKSKEAIIFKLFSK